MKPLMNYLNQLGPRERMLVLALGGVVLVAALYLFIWEPIGDRAERLDAQVAAQRDLVQWMQKAAIEIKNAQKTQTRPAGRGGESLLSLVDRTAKSADLAEALKRVEPEGANRVRVWLELANFDDLVAWLSQVQRDYGLRIDTAVIDRDPSPGRVNARLVFQEGAA